MTEEEIRRFALQLREAERIRAQMANDEVAARVGGGTPPPPISPPAMGHSSGPAVVAA